MYNAIQVKRLVLYAFITQIVSNILLINFSIAQKIIKKIFLKN